MASEDQNNKLSSSSSNLKVPPLKIVLSSHQNNAVVSHINNLDEQRPFKSDEKNDNASCDTDTVKELTKRNSIDIEESCEKQQQKKTSKVATECKYEPGSEQTDEALAFSSSSSSSSSTSENSPSSTPSPEAESVTSNSTIVSEDPQVKTKMEQKDDSPTTNKNERNSRFGLKVSFSERPTNNNSGLLGKVSQEGYAEQGSDASTSNSKELALNANQRITRSSQRAAQQNRTEISGEPNGEDPGASENQDKIHESARKAKRRKCEPQDGEQDGAQTAAEPTVVLADIYPADYQLPSQNSFELYRDIRKRPHKKLMKLSHIQPRVPHGFKDYLINGGPYLLDGNKLGLGLNGAKLDSLNNGDLVKNGVGSTKRIPLRMKLLNLYQASQQRHISYTIPRLLEAPRSLPVGVPLHELFQDQEKTRHQMRMQHLKERERSILAAEQEILRAYNKAAIADVRQKLHLSACTYFYYQERYHYFDEKSVSNGNSSLSEAPSSQDDDLKAFNKEVFLNHLQEIDDKWDKIKKEMLVRHKNESDSLHAVQSLEWEWKAKEIGACDVRVSLKIEPEFVPRVEVASLDY